MNSAWQTHLEQNGAIIEQDRVSHFGDPEKEIQLALETPVLSDLSHQGLILAQGEDTREFLQGQFTNDVKQVDATHSQLSAYCSPKGRILASFRLFQQTANHYIELPRPLLEPTLKRLRMFVLRSKVTLEDASDSLARLGFTAPKADDILKSYLEAVPAEVDEVVNNNDLSVMRIPGPYPRFEIHGEPSKLIKLWGQLKENAQQVGADIWERHDIQAGIPSITTATTEAFVPQMVNLQAINGVSFKKGCYTGQEIVARMQYLGKLKRRMYRAHVQIEAQGDAAPKTGDDLYDVSSGDTQSAGKIVMTQPGPQGGYDLLAVVQISSKNNNDIRLNAPQGNKLTFHDLPYSLTDES